MSHYLAFVTSEWLKKLNLGWTSKLYTQEFGVWGLKHLEMNSSILFSPWILMSLFAYLFIIISARLIDVKCVITLICQLSTFKLGSFTRFWFWKYMKGVCELGKQLDKISMIWSVLAQDSCRYTALLLTSDFPVQAKQFLTQKKKKKKNWKIVKNTLPFL